MHDLIASLIFTICLGAVISTASWGKHHGYLSAELSRKLVHMGMGGLCLTFPWVFQTVLAVQLLGIIAVIGILTLKMTPWKQKVGASLFSVKRVSFGEFLFPVSIAWLFTIGHDKPLLYLVSLLTLTFADAFGALIGTKYGSRHYRTASGQKSIEGSLTFFVISFFCCFIPLYCYLDLHLSQLFIISLAISIISTLLEGISGKGLDNIIIPVAVFLILDFYTTQSEQTLWLKTGILLLLALAFIVSKSVHTLDGGGLIASILFGFGAYSLGGLPCLLTTLLLFLRHLYVAKKYQLNADVKHSVHVVFFIAIFPLTWLTLARGNALPYDIAQQGFILTLACASSLLHAGTLGYLRAPKFRLWQSAVIAILLSTPALLVSSPNLVWLLTPILTSIAIFPAYSFRKTYPQHPLFWLIVSLITALNSAALYYFF